ncbi:MAG: hypothetical protein ACK53Y_18915, partial [bacterium]
MAPLVEKHNRDFRVSYERMFGALYRDKYEYLGDHDLMRVAFRLDIASYYLYVARFLFQNGPHMLEIPPFSPWQAGPFFQLMALYNRRLALRDLALKFLPVLRDQKHPPESNVVWIP